MNLKIEGTVEMPVKSLFEMWEFMNRLAEDNTDLNKKLNKLSDIVCRAIETESDKGYSSLLLDGFEVASVFTDANELKEKYRELCNLKKKEKKDDLSEVSKNSESVVCS